VIPDEFSQPYKHQKLLEAINEAYREELDEEEQQDLEQLRQYQSWLLQQDESRLDEGTGLLPSDE
jgi:hypothetical protein